MLVSNYTGALFSNTTTVNEWYYNSLLSVAIVVQQIDKQSTNGNNA